MILFVSVSMTSLLHVGTFSRNVRNNISIDLLRMSSSGALVFGDLNHTPPPIEGGMFYSASAFYVGTE